MSGTENKTEGQAKEIIGQIKECTGKAVGNDDLTREGQAEQVEGGAQQAAGDLQNAAKTVKDAISDTKK